jgi:hypothetical protein
MLQSAVMDEVPDLPGAEKIVEWFGSWPSFHDSEVVSIQLHRSEPSRISIRAWNMTSEVTAQGYFVHDKQAIVTFVLEKFVEDREGITMVEILGFNQQNVLSNLDVNKEPTGYELKLNGIYGVSGTIKATRISVELEPETQTK